LTTSETKQKNLKDFIQQWMRVTTLEHLLLACETMKELKIGQNKTKGGNRLGVKYDLKGNNLMGRTRQTMDPKKIRNCTWNLTASFTNSQVYTKT
jgi:hypothetical protein